MMDTAYFGDELVVVPPFKVYFVLCVIHIGASEVCIPHPNTKHIFWNANDSIINSLINALIVLIFGF